MSKRELGRRRGAGALLGVVAGSVSLLVAVAPATAADTEAPVVGTAAFAAPPTGNGNWRLTAPQTLQLSATDDVAVAKFQYSLDGGATYVDVPVTAGPSVTANVTLSDEGNTTVRYRAVDSAGNVSRGATTNTTLNQASAAGATAVRLTSTTGRSAGDTLMIDTGAAQETATIATIVTPAPAAPAPNVTLTAPLANAHAANAAVAGTALYSTIALLIDTKGPVATWATQATTLQAAPAAGSSQIRLASLTNRAAGETLQIDQGANAETVKIATVISPAPAAPEPNVVLTSPLQKDHGAGANVYLPSVVDGKILQSQTLTPLRTDPRLRDATDTVANGAGGAAPRRMTIDGMFMVPKTLPLNRLTVGKHTQLGVASGRRRQHGQVHEHVRGHDLVRRPGDRHRPARRQRAADHAQRRDRGRRDRPAAGEPVRVPRRPGARRRLGREPGAGDDRQGAHAAADPEHDALRRGDRGRDPGPPGELLDREPRRPEPAVEQRPGRRPADRARHGRQPGGRHASSATSRRCPRHRPRTWC